VNGTNHFLVSADGGDLLSKRVNTVQLNRYSLRHLYGVSLDASEREMTYVSVPFNGVQDSIVI
jgi:hypothetical protein